MAAMMSMLINFNNAYIIAAFSWPPPLISQLFHPDFIESRTLFFCSLAVFE